MDDNTQRELEKIETLLAEISSQLNVVVRGFPTDANGDIDVDGHRAYHEALMRSAAAQEKFWLDLKQDLIKKGLWAVILVVAGLTVTGVAAKLGLKV